MSEDVYPPTPQRLVASGGSSGGGSEQEPPRKGRRKGTAGDGEESGGGGPGVATIARPAGPGFNRQQFIKSYANMVAQTWVDDAYLDLVLSSPADTLARAGMPTPVGATIRVIQLKITGTGQIKDQVDAWIDGNRTGLYDLFLPEKPDDVDITAGGAVGDACAGGASCCCTPCCCCT